MGCGASSPAPAEQPRQASGQNKSKAAGNRNGSKPSTPKDPEQKRAVSNQDAPVERIVSGDDKVRTPTSESEEENNVELVAPPAVVFPDDEKPRPARDWFPEYRAENVIPPDTFGPTTFSSRGTRTSMANLLQAPKTVRKTKIMCTMGPKCWDEKTLAKLLDAGMNIARFNFSHGSHEQHLQILERVRKVIQQKGSYAACLLDTKGRVIRTAMLKDHQPITLEKGQEVIVEAVGDKFTEFEGYKTATETRIGLSYANLCQTVKPGNRLLLADGSIVIQVVEILSVAPFGGHLMGRVLNDGVLGEKKNCNLPGVRLHGGCLTTKDVDDVQNFCAKHKMDYIAVSFVQTGEDVRLVRRTLDEAGGQATKIICKIENEEGLVNIDDIIRETDGVMVARGCLGMEIPSEKVALAQKMIITKCNIAGKFVVTATQMLESMVKNPLPTRAEMTDVANAVFDGTDAVMLSGETAAGAFPVEAVSTASAIAQNAELGCDYMSQFLFLRVWNYHSAEGMSAEEATMASAAQSAIEFSEDVDGDGVIGAEESAVVVVITESGRAARLVSKYRPPGRLLVVSANEHVLRDASCRFAQVPIKVASLDAPADELIASALALASKSGWVVDGQHVVGVSGVTEASADAQAMIRFVRGPPTQKPAPVHSDPTELRCIKSVITTRVDRALLASSELHHRRSTKIVCTMGPKCWDEKTLGLLLDAGMNVARFNFSHGSHEAHLEVLERYRKVLKEKKSTAACLLDTKGPEIRTAMLRDNKPILLEKGQDVIVEAVGDRYTEFEGYKEENETRIGLSYGKLCQSVKPGNRILVADGSIVIEVLELLSDTELRGKVLNDKELGERKNCNLPGVKVDIPVLTDKDINDVQNFCAKHKMDYIAVSFVQTGEDVRLVRRTLDEAGGQATKIICKIENEAGMANIDDIIRETDGVMVARGDLGMEIPSEKVALAQKMIITKCNIAGKFVVTATQMLESMVKNPLPTRAEMTDVANSVIDGTDAVMLSGETANGSFAASAVRTMASIVANAEVGINKLDVYNFIRNWTAKPMSLRETLTSSAVQASFDMQASLIVVCTDDLRTATLVSKWRPLVPIVVVTTQESVLRSCNANYGLVPLKVQAVSALSEIMSAVEVFVREKKIAKLRPGDGKSDQVVVVYGKDMDMTSTRLEMTTFVYGDETANLVIPTAYAGPETVTMKSTKVGLDLVCEPVFSVRKTKIVCTMGPKCWDEKTLGLLLDAGMNVARFNFSHGSHEAHLEVLERYRKVLKEKKSTAACLLDTKGPEIRTAMLRDNNPILLEKGQDVIVEAVGDRYTEFEGYKDENETRIGLSYGKLCQSVKPGNRILVADGSIVIEVLELLSDTELRGKVLNDKELGERKNCNLPGVKVDIPVLTDKDINDVQNFCAKHKMDYIAVSFVQTGEDVRLVRRTLDEAGGQATKIICKIENEEGLVNIDDIIRETDGVMVARGDLGMEIPSEKVALAQKMIITKCNIAGKFVVTATQMLESMVKNPLPTRAEMTDVANAVFDGTDAVMLSGETANGSFPVEAVATMASIAEKAEVGVNYNQVAMFIRDFTPKPTGTLEAVLSCVAKNAVDVHAGAIVCFSQTGLAPSLIAKYRPSVPVLVVTPDAHVQRLCSSTFALVPYSVRTFPKEDGKQAALMAEILQYAVEQELCPSGSVAVVVRGTRDMSADHQPLLLLQHAPGKQQGGSTMVHRYAGYEAKYDSTKTVSIRATAISLEQIRSPLAAVRKTKIVCTMGPKCWDEKTLGLLLDAGMNVARFNFSHGSHEAHLEVLERYRKVLKEKKSTAACLLDTKGPEIRTAMLRDNKPILLEKGQDVIVEAVGDRYTEFEGYKEENETRIGLSYGKLCQSVKPGNRILVADGSIVIEVLELLSDTELRGKVLNDKELGERKNCNLPGVKVDIPVLTDKDINDVQNFCAKHKMDYIAVSFVQTGEDVRLVRRTLDEAGGQATKIICKIENEEGLVNIDDIIRETDGVMVARGDLGMEIPSEKVALAQKMIITKCNIAGKFVVTATQMLESMVKNPLPTRAEMTDVANAVFDGTDAVMLSGETANGSFPVEAVATMASIASNAEVVNNSYAMASFIRDFTAKPMSCVEQVASGAAKVALDCKAVLCMVLTSDGKAASLVSKYKPAVPVLVVTACEQVARGAAACFAQHALVMEGLARMPHGQAGQQRLGEAVEAARRMGLVPKEGGVVVLLAEAADGQQAVSFHHAPPLSATEEHLLSADDDAALPHPPLAEGDAVPKVVFKARVRDERVGGPNPFAWKDVRSEELLAGKRVVLFALPGAFTPTCSATHLPGYQSKYHDILAEGVDEVYCLSVNDAFVMRKWGLSQGLTEEQSDASNPLNPGNFTTVKLIPDGACLFTRGMGMTSTWVENRGFGERSWRYSMVVDDGKIEKLFLEGGGVVQDSDPDPFEVSDADTMLEYLRSRSRRKDSV